MYLSCLMLNPRSKRAQQELANAYELHRSVYKAFPPVLPPEERVLFRVDEHPQNGLPMLLVQSRAEPDWREANASAGYLLSPARCKSVDLGLQAGQVYAFRLRANPVVKKATHEREPEAHPGYVAAARERRSRGEPEPGRNGIRLGLVREEEQRAWLERQAARHGFALLQVTVIPEGLQRAWPPGGRPISHLSVRYDGLLRVLDAAGLEAALREGIGPAKGFGFGLLSLGPPPQPL